ncbi:MAG: hypothetical protein RLO06_14785 [Parvibaculum sp.]
MEYARAAVLTGCVVVLVVHGVGGVALKHQVHGVFGYFDTGRHTQEQQEHDVLLHAATLFDGSAGVKLGVANAFGLHDMLGNAMARSCSEVRGLLRGVPDNFAVDLAPKPSGLDESVESKSRQLSPSALRTPPVTEDGSLHGDAAEAVQDVQGRCEVGIESVAARHR